MYKIIELHQNKNKKKKFVRYDILIIFILFSSMNITILYYIVFHILFYRCELFDFFFL